MRCLMMQAGFRSENVLRACRGSARSVRYRVQAGPHLKTILVLIRWK